MSTLTAAQIASYAAQAGFSGTGLRDAIAVALAESGGRTDAVNINHDSYHSRDRGLWQINDHWHPEVSDAQAFSPAGAATAAFRISAGGSNWSQWATWPIAAQAQMGRATLAASQAAQHPTASATAQNANWWSDLGKIGGFNIDPPYGSKQPLDPSNHAGALSDAITAPVKALKALVELAGKVGAWMADSHNWLRVLYVIGGAGAVLLGLEMIGRSGAGGQTLTKATSSINKAATTAGKLAVVA